MFNVTLNKNAKYKIIQTNLLKGNNRDIYEKDNNSFIQYNDYKKTLIPKYDLNILNRPRSEHINLHNEILSRSISTRPKLDNNNRRTSLAAGINTIKKADYLNVNVFKANNAKSVKPTNLDKFIDKRTIMPAIPNNKNKRSQQKPKYPIQRRLSTHDNIEVSLDKDSCFYNPVARSVKEYSYKEDSNKEHREAMEDVNKVIDKFMNDNNKGLFCLYDGHGGIEPANYVKNRLPDMFAKFLIDSNFNIEKSFIYTFQKVDDELKVLSQSDNVGTTACIVYFYKETDILLGTKRYFVCANVGDTRCVLITNKETKRISYDHKSTDESEIARIKRMVELSSTVECSVS
jgi:hypothetical protein